MFPFDTDRFEWEMRIYCDMLVSCNFNNCQHLRTLFNPIMQNIERDAWMLTAWVPISRVPPTHYLQEEYSQFIYRLLVRSALKKHV